ncbi:type VI secretion system ATPase TssH [Aureliella helgolandensis]|uniref:Chaperone protein ClpB n=1 Tax=Aureliella helgolandensis TaxID=2527968 RepID=A0A518GAG4_9BACT|nr:type VI secretion system ATPase TssH [Aureliella helgolandensis]QDV25574.1 Chaperone protein ClpB [Aureliella helgolandensis]
MVQVNLKNLIERLNPTCKKSLEGAAGLCLSRTNYNVEVEHWLAKLLEDSQTDLSLCLKAFDVDISQLQRDLTQVIDRFKTGNAKSPALSPDVVEWVREAYVLAAIDYTSAAVTSGHLLCALLGHDPLARSAHGASKEFEKVSLESLKKNLWQLTVDSQETRETPAASTATGPAAAAGGKTKGATTGGPSRTPSLDQFTIDLTARARNNEIDPVLGRDSEIRQIVDILTRRRQNNPILTGEAGVGKTAVVEGFALRIAAGDVPPALRDVALHTLDLGLLQAGAGVKGEFENRLKSVIDEVKASAKPIILFIDEAHTLIGAGGSAGQGDAANLLKPALARGELRTVAATTWAEYKKYFEKDAALARRFQVVKVEEPAESVAVEMLRGLTGTLEKHHGVRILDEAIVDAVKLSSRYISGRQLPDKAVSLIDTTCARIGISQASSPPALEDAQRRIEQLKVTHGILEREMATGAEHQTRLEELDAELATTEQALENLQTRWNQERELVTRIEELAKQLEGNQAACENGGADNAAASKSSPDATASPASAGSPPETASPALQPAERKKLLTEYQTLSKELETLQGEQPLVHPCVDCQAIAETVASWTGIPVGRMMANEINTVLQLNELMEKQIIGQAHALDRIAQSIRTSRAQLSDPRAPIGVFLLAGTSGVGKTETAITLAELLYGGEQNMTTINMSEFKEEHKVSLLMGSPPGYVGYGEGGVLTEAVRRKPYSVILLDEMEKAHPGVQDIFYQVFDKGNMKDGEGRDIDFKNTVILMTTNAGTDLIKSLCSDPETSPEPEAFLTALFPELLKTFKPAFLGRTTIIPYYPLNDEVLRKIVGLKLDKLARRVADNYGAKFTYEPELIQTIAERCTEVDTGARNIDHILTRTLLPELSVEFLAHLAEGKEITQVQVGITDDQTFSYQIS